MNIVEILKYCPKGTKLYSLIDGEVTLGKIESPKVVQYPIEVIISDYQTNYYTKDGLYSISHPGECVLFPSKKQRDWSKFRLPVKDGDIMMTTNKRAFITNGKIDNDGYPCAYCGINLHHDFIIGSTTNGWTSSFYIPASEEAKKELFIKMGIAGYTWNAETLELEKIEPKFKEGDVIIDKKGSIFLISRILDVGGSTLEMAAVLNKEGLTINPNVWQNPYDKSIASEEDKNKLFSAITKEGYRYNKEQHTFIKQDFKPFDKVLVRDASSQKWSINLFSYYDEEDEAHPYVCLNERYSYCIPYEDNEYLVGKTINPPHMK